VVETLDGPERKEEIARMLSGAKITDEARAAADQLIDGIAS
jgi:DNA repair protein RecN (Recombination protein N)